MKILKTRRDVALEVFNIRPISEKFEREKLFYHELIWKDGPYAIFRYHYMKTERLIPKWKFEAVVIRIKKPHPDSSDKRLYEALPSNSDWGKYGWSLNSFEKAHEQIELVKSDRAHTIESNYRSRIEKGRENSEKGRASDSNLPLPPYGAIQERYPTAILEGRSSS